MAHNSNSSFTYNQIAGDIHIAPNRGERSAPITADSHFSNGCGDASSGSSSRRYANTTIGCFISCLVSALRRVLSVAETNVWAGVS